MDSVLMSSGIEVTLQPAHWRSSSQSKVGIKKNKYQGIQDIPVIYPLVRFQF